MFEKRTAMYLRDVFPKEVKEDDGTSRKCLVLKMQLQPFTAEQAGELNVKTRLFDSKGDAHQDVQAATLSIRINGLQGVTFHRAPDAEMPQSLVLRNITVEQSVKVRCDGETPQYAATFTLVTDGMPAPKDLLYLIEGHASQHFLTFEDEQGDLLEDEDQAAARKPALRHPKKGKAAKGEVRPGVKEEFDDTGAPTGQVQ